jgi:hypothetical protein
MQQAIEEKDVKKSNESYDKYSIYKAAYEALQMEVNII